ncbi:MAG: DUF3795 domain-containing protein [Oscillospiraceae bacterium]|nr:DUF3795 domain-containing protein [Oscillospiraceae bacterium]
MQEHISCCGRNCYECRHFPHECLGCNEESGRVFWLQYVDEVICPIYNCCRNDRHSIDCGLCGEHPCWRYEEDKVVPDEFPLLEIIEPKWIDIKVS